MELKEIESLLTKILRVGMGRCESCNRQFRIAEFDVYSGTFLCPECLRKISWKKENVVEL
jgi:RNA polymerase-binding transcription factor DksA